MAGLQRERGSGGTTLLRTKLAPPRLRSRRIPRPRLEALLDESLERRILVVCSPAGFGKTTLIGGWLANRTAKVGWLSLDEYDNEPLRFWCYVAAALDSAVGGIGSEAAAMLASREPPPIEAVLTGLLNSAAAAGEEIILVLDDYHAVSDEAIHRSLRFFLSHLPPSLHVVIMTREEPPLGLASFRARAELIEATVDELRFSAEEVAAFLRDVAGLAVGDETVASLARLTEGWAAALQLAALTLEGNSESAVPSFSGSNEYLFSYLAEEVFDRLDPPLQHFLLRTAQLERFCGELCDEVAADYGGRDQLPILGRLNLFLVPLDSERSWYRYHGLFRDFLRSQARRLLPEGERGSLLLAASAWFGRQGMAGEAIRGALEAGDREAAADLITRWAGLFFETSDLIALRDWIGLLPGEALEKRPALCLVDAWALLATGRAAEVEPSLAMVEQTLGARADGSQESHDSPAKTRCALAEVALIRSSVAFAQFDLQQIERDCLLALEYLPDECPEVFFNNPASIRTTAMFNLAITYEYSGDIERATSTFEQALAGSRETQNIHLIPMISAHLGNLRMVQGRLSDAQEIYRGVVEASTDEPRSPLSGLAYVGYGSVLLERNRLDEAHEYLAAGVELGKRWANWEVLLPGLPALARANRALGHPERAAQAVAELATRADELEVPPAARTIAALYEAYYSGREGRPGELAAARGILNASADLPYLQESEAILSCRLLLASGAAPEAAGHLARLEKSARGGGRLGRLIEILALESVSESLSGRPEAAELHLRGALGLGEKEDYVRLFLELGTPMVRLLESSCGQTAYGRRLLAAVAGGTSAPLPGGLSERELEVLRDLATGSSNQQTADRLFISVNTVKTHLKNIFAKLSISSRAQAVARGRELGLLPEERRPR